MRAFFYDTDCVIDTLSTHSHYLLVSVFNAAVNIFCIVFLNLGEKTVPQTQLTDEGSGSDDTDSENNSDGENDKEDGSTEEESGNGNGNEDEEYEDGPSAGTVIVKADCGKLFVLCICVYLFLFTIFRFC